MKKYIIGIGEVLWDVLPSGKKLGGAPANFAFHAGQFGLESMVISAIGNDALGDEILDEFEKKQLKNHLNRVNHPTGTVDIIIDNEGIPSYKINTDTAWDNISLDDDLLDIAHDTQAVCFGSLAKRNKVSRDTINAFIEAMPKENSLKIFDINIRQNFYSQEIIEESCKQCDILKLNDEELPIIQRFYNLEKEPLAKSVKSIITMFNLKMVILTCGAMGSYIFTPESVSYIDTPKVAIADTVGAGDSFTATFVASLMKGKSIAEAHKKAVDVAAYVCSQAGAMPILPHNII